MVNKRILAISALVLLGLLAAWFARPAAAPSPAVTPTPQASTAATRPPQVAVPAETPAALAIATAKPAEIPAEPAASIPEPATAAAAAALRAAQFSSNPMFARQRYEVENRIRSLVQEIKLTPDQQAILTRWLDDLAAGGAVQAGGSPEISTRSFSDLLAGSLTPGQQEALTRIETGERTRQSYDMASRHLFNLTDSIKLEDSQREAVLKILTRSAEEHILRYGAPTTVGPDSVNGSKLDPNNLGIREFMLAPRSLTDPKAESLDQFVARRIEEKVEALRPVLNAAQLEQYRADLKSPRL